MSGIYIPYGAYWSTPFARWQSSFAELHALEFAAWTAKHALDKRGIDTSLLQTGVLGTTIPQKGSFYGLPWLTGLMDAAHMPGPTIAQACATSARCVQHAAQEIALDQSSSVLIVTADRTSNGPHIYYPSPASTGGRGQTEDWVLSNFDRDPFAGCNMVTTAENVASKWNVTTAEQNAVTIRRYEQYSDAIAKDHAFQRRYMDLPFSIPDRKFLKTAGTINGDIGVQPLDRDKIVSLKPVLPDGTVTFAGQTHPADGNAGMIVCDAELATEFSTDGAVKIKILGFGSAREKIAYMPAAPIKAAAAALQSADVAMRNIVAVKSHNPFAVNDIVFSRETGFDLMAMNNYGCSLVWGHPQAPTGLRAMIELIEELALRGGGVGLFQGCAAGDVAMAVIISVEVDQ